MMDQKLSELSNKLDKITAKFEQNSQHITSAEDIIVGLESRLSDTESKLTALTHRVVDAGARRENLKLFNVKAGIEGKDPVSFFETWLPKKLGIGGHYRQDSPGQMPQKPHSAQTRCPPHRYNEAPLFF